MMMSEGSIVYHGPREGVLAFFEGLGFACPHDMGVADFLQGVTMRTDQQASLRYLQGTVALAPAAICEWFVPC
jgi:hypothetical protein